MSITQALVPHILSAITSAPQQEERFENIVRFVEARLQMEGIHIQNLKDEVERGLQVGADFGLLAANNNMFRLKFNPKSKPPFGVQHREGRRSNTQMDSEQDEDSDEERDEDYDPMEGTSAAKNPSAKSSETSIWPHPTHLRRRRRRRSRTRRRCSRSRSRRRRRY